MLYGPAGLAEYLQCTLDASQTRLAYPIKTQVARGRLVYEDETVRVECAPLVHRAPAFGYAIVETEQAGRFDAEKAQALGIPAGPLYGRLKQGERVTLPDGRTIDGADLVGPPRPGRKLVYCGDTAYTPNAVTLARDADVLIHEATYLEEDRALAARAQHSTALSAARVAREAGVGLLILTHFSPRYEAGGRLGELLAEARSIFPNTLLADDFFSYDIPRKSGG
jgi:ribonuclease Z